MIRKLTKIYACGVLVLFFAVPVLAEYNFGETGAQILDMHTSARIAALGMAGVGISDDVNSVIYNPAGLTQLEKTQLQFTHVFYFLGTRLNSFSFGREFDNFGVGFNLKYFGTKDTVRDVSGNEGESFDVTYMQYSIGAGYPLSDIHSLGLTIKTVFENIYNEEGSVLGFDVGWQCKFSGSAGYKTKMVIVNGLPRIIRSKNPARVNTFGAVIRNIGDRIKIGDAKSFELPREFAVGGAHETGLIEQSVIVWEIVTNRQAVFGGKVGVEKIMEGFKIRMGFKYITNPNVTLGFEVSDKNWLINYAFYFHRDIGMTHRVSLGVKL